VRRMINRQVVDLLETSRALLDEVAPADIEAVRRHPGRLIRFSPEMEQLNLELKRFLRTALYRHVRVHRMSVKAARIVRQLFAAFLDDPRLLPPEHQQRARAAEAEQGTAGRARVVADYIAGMTDRYAIREHRRLFDAEELT